MGSSGPGVEGLCVWGGGGSTLIVPYIRRLGPPSWVQNFEFQYFCGFQKNEYFWGMKKLLILFWGH